MRASGHHGINSDTENEEEYNINDIQKKEVKCHDRLSEVVIGLLMKNVI